MLNSTKEIERTMPVRTVNPRIVNRYMHATDVLAHQHNLTFCSCPSEKSAVIEFPADMDSCTAQTNLSIFLRALKPVHSSEEPSLARGSCQESAPINLFEALRRPCKQRQGVTLSRVTLFSKSGWREGGGGCMLSCPTWGMQCDAALAQKSDGFHRAEEEQRKRFAVNSLPLCHPCSAVARPHPFSFLSCTIFLTDLPR